MALAIQMISSASVIFAFNVELFAEVLTHGSGLGFAGRMNGERIDGSCYETMTATRGPASATRGARSRLSCKAAVRMFAVPELGIRDHWCRIRD